MTLLLPIGYTRVEVDPLVDQSQAAQGLSHRRARGPFSRRRWMVQWDAVGQGAQRYLEQLFLDRGQGAAALEWTPPNNFGLAVHVRMLNLTVTEKSATDRTMTATLEEVLEPC